MKSTGYYSDEIKKLKKAIEEADAVVIGAGAGLSTSAGFVYNGERFEKYFSEFGKKYGFKDMYSGGFYPYDTPEKARTLLCYALNKVLCAFVRSDACDELLLLNKSIDASLAELREEKKLLANIRSAVKELQKYNIDECNYDMALLLALINEKNDLMLRKLNEEVKGLGIRLRGIDYYSNSKIQEDLDLVSENIDYKVQKLELTHKY
jgi:hypothetical protein